jgi:hypothetical protein
LVAIAISSAYGITSRSLWPVPAPENPTPVEAMA